MFAYAPEGLMRRAAEITLDSGVTLYDALFLALALRDAFFQHANRGDPHE